MHNICDSKLPTLFPYKASPTQKSGIPVQCLSDCPTGMPVAGTVTRTKVKLRAPRCISPRSFLIKLTEIVMVIS